jgi:hypothetical protein
VVYIGSLDDGLLAFAADGSTNCTGTPYAGRTCSPLWTGETRHQNGSSPTVANGMVYIGGHDGDLFAFNAANGTPQWAANSGGPITSSPTVANGVVYVGCSVRVRRDEWEPTLDRSHQRERWIDRCVADRCQRGGLRRIWPPVVHVRAPLRQHRKRAFLTTYVLGPLVIRSTLECRVQSGQQPPDPPTTTIIESLMGRVLDVAVLSLDPELIDLVVVDGR